MKCYINCFDLKFLQKAIIKKSKSFIITVIYYFFLVKLFFLNIYSIIY